MSKPTPFEVTSEALEVVASLLQEHPNLEPALMLIPSFEQLDEKGAVQARFEREHFMFGYDSPDKFLQWPHVELCGRRVPIAPDALERLRGRTLTIQALDIIYVAGGKETREFLVAA